MRTAFLYIMSMGMILVLSSIDSCESTDETSARNREMLIGSRIDSVESFLTSDKLSSASLEAFESKAKQNLVDFMDYMVLYSDPSVHREFKVTIMQLARSLVISDSIMVTYPENVQEEFASVPLSVLPEYSKNTMPYSIQLDSVEISEHLKRSSAQAYSGKLSYIASFQLESRPDSGKLTSFYRQQKFHVVKSPGIAGETQSTWKILLGTVTQE